jgi:hypothetical protein
MECRSAIEEIILNYIYKKKGQSIRNQGKFPKTENTNESLLFFIPLANTRHHHHIKLWNVGKSYTKL